MVKLIRITNNFGCKSPCSKDYTPYFTDATHHYFYFAEYIIQDDGNWEEGRSWDGVVSIQLLHQWMLAAGLLTEITPSKQLGGQHEDPEP